MSTNQSLQKLTSSATINQIIDVGKNAGELLASIGLSPEDHKFETLQSVCQQKKWDEMEVLKWLKRNQQVSGVQSVKNNEKLPEFGNNLTKWCEYLEKKFLTKHRQLLEEISSDYPRVRKIHGNQYGWLKNMRWPLEKLEEKVSYYLDFQRRKLFPLFNELKDSKKKVLHGTITKINHGIEIIEEDQNEVLDLIDTIEKKGQGLKNPEGACSTLRILNYNLETLFASLRKQIKIERKHLLPLVKQKLASE